MQIIKTLGQIAGIGGISLGVSLSIFRELIRKSIFPKLKQDDAYRLLRLIAVLASTVAVAGLGAWTYVVTSPKQSAPDSVAFSASLPSAAVHAGHDITARNIVVDQSGNEQNKGSAVSAEGNINAQDISVKH